MKRLLMILSALACFIQLAHGQYRAGTGRMVITPDSSIWLSGYASRNKPSTGVLADLWVKAVVIEKDGKTGIIIITMDIIGLSREMTETIAGRITAKYNIDRSGILLNSSHTHSGPVIWPRLSLMFNLSSKDISTLLRYKDFLADQVVAAADQAFSNLRPARISVAHGSADIAVNRRQFSGKGVAIGVNNEGPVDKDVPVLKIETPEGRLRTVLFGYACHNTTLDIYEVNGDYAGFAQMEIEKEYEGVTAMFIAGCGADQNPNPRRSVELAMKHGKSLADAVSSVLSGEFTEIKGPVKTSYTETVLELNPYPRSWYEEELTGNDRHRARRAEFTITAIDKGYDIGTMRYPVQAVRFGKDFTILALSGEVVVDYSLGSKLRYPRENLFVSAYCNEVQCYIPSKRILKEGGYEAETSMIYYNLPGPFMENVEEKVYNAADRVMKKTGAKIRKDD